ncbi:hypothetical protein ACHAQJ_009937 [Trichoderma viride]
MKPSFTTALFLLSATAIAQQSPLHSHTSKHEFSTSHKITIDLPSGQIIGRSLRQVDTFNGIPYAAPPIGPLRLRPPVRISKHLGVVDATGVAPACPQPYISNRTLEYMAQVSDHMTQLLFLKPVHGQEDCLTVSVQRPSKQAPGVKLPVLVWLPGGGFVMGASSQYDGTALLYDAIQDDMPFLFVTVNYRVGAFGFMPGAEILQDGSANAGVLDQRMALEWIADNIEYFGGNPDKVVLWGESAGSCSIVNQMLLFGGNATYNGRSLFRGGIMSSGSLLPANPIDCPKGQAVYDAVVAHAGCSEKADTLACLREVDYNTFVEAANTMPTFLSYTSNALSFVPRPDGKVLPGNAVELVATGRYHAVPFIIGAQEDEGTLFALFQESLQTDEDIVDYFTSLYFHDATTEQVATLVNAYPTDLTGSPFSTPSSNTLYPNYKRLAALLGDLTFGLSRRLFLELTSATKPDVPSWSYLASYLKGLPYVGTYHGSDLAQVFHGAPTSHATRSSRRFYLNFLYELDPNKGRGGHEYWPEWRKERQLLWYKTQCENDYLADDFREGAFSVIRDLGNSLNL